MQPEILANLWQDLSARGWEPIVEQSLQKTIGNNKAFRRFFADEHGQSSLALDGHEVRVFAEVEDILLQSGLAWFCARLQPAYGTVEDRISCQQPPHAHLCASALTVGLVDNYRPLLEIANAYSLDQWRNIRLLAARHALDFSYSSLPLKELTAQMLSIAEKGLRQRGFGEEVYLEPLYQRLAANRCPADDVLLQFRDSGVEGIIASHDMRNLLYEHLKTEYTP